MSSVTTVGVRDAARVIVLDEHERVLLLRYDENGGFHATPGVGKTRAARYKGLS
jgi:hypothetical protein